MPACDHTTSIAPDQSIIDSDGHDWSWAFVVFRDVPGYPGYVVGSNYTIWSRWGKGRRRPDGPWHRMKTSDNGVGHRYVYLARSGELRRKFYVHQLVLMAFVGPCPPGMEACHYPIQDPGYCVPWNLRWDTRLGNVRDAIRAGRLQKGIRNGHAILDELTVLSIVDEGRRGRTAYRIAKDRGLRKGTVANILKGTNWSWLTGIVPDSPR